jgi:hypothetical protein
MNARTGFARLRWLCFGVILVSLSSTTAQTVRLAREQQGTLSQGTIPAPTPTLDNPQNFTGSEGAPLSGVTIGGLPNDNCSNPTLVSNGTYAFSTFGATTDGPNEPVNCNFFSFTQIGQDIWFCYTATCTGTATVSLCGSTFDTKMAIYDGCSCPLSGSSIVCNDDFCTLQSQVAFPTTAGHQYLLRVGGYQSATGSGTMNISCAGSGPLCDVQCSSSSFEGESDCGLSTDTVNGGCNSTPPVFSSIVCNQSFCGTLAASGGARDTDWYELQVSSPTQINWSVIAECDIVIGVINNSGVANCAGINGFRVMAQGGPCQQITVTDCLPAGTWWLYIAPPVGATVSCGAEYDAELTCSSCGAPSGACCNGQTCTIVTQAVCSSGGGIYRGDGVPCSPSPCSQPAPPNDFCAQAQPLSVPGVASGSTAFALQDSASYCGTSITGPGIWYSVSGTGHTLTASTCSINTLYDTKLNVFCGTCSDLSCIDGNDDASCSNGSASTISWCSVAGRTYYVLVQGYNNASGAFQLSVSDDGVPCSTAVDCGSSGCSLTCSPGAIPENEPGCGQGTDTVNGGCLSDPPVFSPISCGQTYCGTAARDGINEMTDWYQVQLPSDTQLTWTVAAEFHSLIGIMDNDGVPVCQPDLGFLNYAVGDPCETASVTACLSAGTWWLVVETADVAQFACGAKYQATLSCQPCTAPLGSCCLPGGFCQPSISSYQCDAQGGTWNGPGTSCSPPPCPSPPINDSCFSATSIGDGNFPFTTLHATTDGPDEPSACGLSGYSQLDSDVWYCYVAPCTGTATFNTCSSNFDTKLAVYSGCTCPPGPAVDCDDDGCGSQSQVSVDVIQGGSYLVRIGGYQGAQGSGTLSAQCASSSGACCTGQSCLVTTQAGCTGVFQGVGSTCQASTCASLSCPTCLGDMNSDTIKDGRDIQGFVNCLLGGGANCGCGDLDGNGSVGTSDIPGFATALLAGGTCPNSTKRCLYQIVCMDGPCDNCGFSVGNTCYGPVCANVNTCPATVSTKCGAAQCCVTWNLIACQVPGSFSACTMGDSCTVACDQTPGACCLPNGSCGLMIEVDCRRQGGTYQGDGVPCGLTGACCFANGTCMDTNAACCTAAGGTFKGVGASCTSIPNPCKGACCDNATGACTVKPASQCAGAGVTYGGDGTDCQPLGACCKTDGTCVDTTQACCTASGGTFRGVGSTCADSPCKGACCDNTTGACTIKAPSQCAGAGMTFKGLGTSCSATGACCKIDGTCVNTTQDCCTAAGGTFGGVGTACNDATNPCKGACCNSTNGNCTITAPNGCGGAGQSYLGNGTTCSASGACCVGNTCLQTTIECCTQIGGFFQSGATCTPNPCPQPFTVQILSEAGAVLTNTTNGTVAIRTTYKLKVTPGATVVAEKQWTIDGAAVPASTVAISTYDFDMPDFTDGDGSITPKNLVAADLKNNELTLFWTKPAVRSLKLRVKDNNGVESYAAIFVNIRHDSDPNKNIYSRVSNTDRARYNPGNYKVCKNHGDWHHAGADEQKYDRGIFTANYRGAKFFIWHRLIIDQYQRWRTLFNVSQSEFPINPALGPNRATDISGTPLTYLTALGGKTPSPVYGYVRLGEYPKVLEKPPSLSGMYPRGLEHVGDDIHPWHALGHSDWKGPLPGPIDDLPGIGDAYSNLAGPKESFWSWHSNIDLFRQTLTPDEAKIVSTVPQDGALSVPKTAAAFNVYILFDRPVSTAGLITAPAGTEDPKKSNQAQLRKAAVTLQLLPAGPVVTASAVALVNANDYRVHKVTFAAGTLNTIGQYKVTITGASPGYESKTIKFTVVNP